MQNPSISGLEIKNLLVSQIEGRVKMVRKCSIYDK